MTEAPSQERIKELELQLKSALDDLVRLAEERKEHDFEPWNDPDAIRGIIDTINAQVEAKPEHTELAQLITLAARQYGELFRHYAEHADKLAEEGKVSDSLTSYIKLTSCFEMLFISYATILGYQLELLAGSGEQFDKLQDGIYEEAKMFKVVLDGLRKHHDWLYDYKYMMKL